VGLRTTAADVEVAFWRYDPAGGTGGAHDNALRLKGAYKRDSHIYCGPHPDSGTAKN
jgi:hypothetical protein